MKTNLVKRVGLLILVIVIGAGLTVGCSGNKVTNPDNTGGTPGGGNPTPSNLVTISSFAFSPATITISVGDTVNWRNNDSVNHTVTSNSGGVMNSMMMSHSQTYQKIFTQAGTYPYHCTVHTGMTGTVIVQ